MALSCGDRSWAENVRRLGGSAYSRLNNREGTGNPGGDGDGALAEGVKSRAELLRGGIFDTHFRVSKTRALEHFHNRHVTQLLATCQVRANDKRR